MKAKPKTRKKVRSRLVKRQSHKSGLPPGTLVHVGDQMMDHVRMTLLDYDEERFDERQLERIEDAYPYKASPTVTWLNIDGLHDISVIEKLGKQFCLHGLTLEDIVHTGQRAKVEDMDTYLFVVLRMLTYSEETRTVQSEQVSFILGDHMVLSFQETVGDVFDPIRDRLRHAKGRVRKCGADYLLYTLLDAIVDNYFDILEKIGEHVEALEEELVTAPDEGTLHEIHELKREMIFLRKSVWPLREMINSLERSESVLIEKSTIVYLRDVYDHTIQVIDTVESFRDMVSGMLDIYLSSISNRMNAVMKVLTVIATLFIPLTFLAGVYGMNFKNMPEIGWKYSYAGFWLITLGILVSMVIYFKRKKWF
ncbi:MAG: magnesium/cobalt transporter CorA [Phycisphaerae bacterium]|nr:magnesium/cobalt transporter CorA [Phycisphaerae bacterium]